MSVIKKTEIVVSHHFGEQNALEKILIRLAKQRMESESSNLRASDENGIIRVAKHPIIMPTSETEAQ